MKECQGSREELRRLRQVVVERMRTWSPVQNIAATILAVQTAVARIAGDRGAEDDSTGTPLPAGHGRNSGAASLGPPAASGPSKLHE